MLGRETDLILVDLHDRKVYNFGWDASYADVEKFVSLMDGPKRIDRFVLVSGTELGFDSPTGKSVKNPSVRRIGK